MTHVPFVEEKSKKEHTSCFTRQGRKTLHPAARDHCLKLMEKLCTMSGRPHAHFDFSLHLLYDDSSATALEDLILQLRFRIN